MAIGDILLTALASSALTVAVLAIVTAALRATVIRTITHQFDTALEQTKSNLKKDEEAIKAALAAQNARVDALLGDALKTNALRNELIERKRIDAIEKIWAAVIEWMPLEAASRAAQTVKVDEALKSAAEQTAEAMRIRQFADEIAKVMDFSLKSIKPMPRVDNLRLVAPPLAWALFSAYRSLVMDPVLRFEMMRIGVPPDFLKDREELTAAVRAALPNMNKYIDQFGDEALPHLVETLRDRLFQELQENLRAPAVDEVTIAKAAEIMRYVDKAIEGQQRALAPVPTPPTS